MRSKYLSIVLGVLLPTMTPLAGHTQESARSERRAAAGSNGPIDSIDRLDNQTQLVAGDQLTFRIAEDGDPATSLVVSDSGQIQVPYIGSVVAAGKTPREVAAEIKKALENNLYHKATVLISLEKHSERSPGRIFVSGEINRQGPIALRADEKLTVSEAILEAGGFSDFANKKKVRVIRKGPGPHHMIVVDVAQIVNKGRTDLDVTLHPGDVVMVPARLINW